LFNINLNIKKGEKVAIIGRTGSGKSTLLRLAQGLYLPTSGSVMLDGLELRQLDPAEFRNQIGYVPQNLMLFSGSLRENLLMGNSYASEAELSSIMKRYGVVDFAQRHPMGIDMPVGESGSALSGGQRQVVSIARAMIKNPSLILLDEPTSELDQGTESRVIKALKEDMKDKTVVVVTHKMSILDLADRIIVMDFGKVIMDGPKKDVIAQLKKGNIQA
jgi:ATP-binding cassette subfamily C protein LapB